MFEGEQNEPGDGSFDGKGRWATVGFGSMPGMQGRVLFWFQGLGIRPWSEFFSRPMVKSEKQGRGSDNGESWKRAKKNWSRYRANYLVGLLLGLLGAVVAKMEGIMALIFLAALWGAFLIKDADPLWMPKIGTLVVLDDVRRWWLMGLVTAGVICLTARGRLLLAVWRYSCVSIAHSMVVKYPGEAIE